MFKAWTVEYIFPEKNWIVKMFKFKFQKSISASIIRWNSTYYHLTMAHKDKCETIFIVHNYTYKIKLCRQFKKILHTIVLFTYFYLTHPSYKKYDLKMYNHLPSIWPYVQNKFHCFILNNFFQECQNGFQNIYTSLTLFFLLL